jgi:small subunit ribosomal protein S20
VANTKQAIKRHRQSLTSRARNRYNTATMRTELKHAREALASESGDATDAVKTVVTRLDRITTRGAIPKKRASRLKSRLMKQLAAK